MHGLYSKRERVTLSELIEEVYETEGALENSDRDLAALKATAWTIKERLETVLPQVDVLDGVLEAVESTVQRIEGEMSVADAVQIARDVQAVERVLSTFVSLTRGLVEVQLKSITAHKVRAETEAKLAEAQALETFGKLCLALRPILSETIADRDVYEALEARIRREILSPVRLELPN